MKVLPNSNADGGADETRLASGEALADDRSLAPPSLVTVIDLAWLTGAAPRPAVMSSMEYFPGALLRRLLGAL